jgi:hypothetical protein
MLYLHDVWVNWSSEENPYMVHQFEAWFRDDQVDLMDQIPLLHVNTNLFNYIAFGFNKVANEVLNAIKDKAYRRKNHERILEKYAFVCTDSRGVIAVLLDHNGLIIKKSYLIPRQFQLVMEMVSGESADFILEDEIDVSNYDTYSGRTRQEKDTLNKTTEFVKNLESDKLEMLKYLVAEFDLNLHKFIKNNSFEDIKNTLLEEVKVSQLSRLSEFNKVIDKLKVLN